MAIPQNIKNRITISSSNPTSEYIPKRIESRVSKRYLNTQVHGSSPDNTCHKYSSITIRYKYGQWDAKIYLGNP